MFIETGDYKVFFYDKYGRKMKGFEGGATTNVAAKQLGVETIDFDEEAVSFTIDRRVFNSLDKD